MEKEIQSWDKIKADYNQEWVELISYDWPDTETYPISGIVRSHGSEKKDFYTQCQSAPVPDDSAILFVGPPKVVDSVALTPSLAFMLVQPCES